MKLIMTRIICVVVFLMHSLAFGLDLEPIATIGSPPTKVKEAWDGSIEFLLWTDPDTVVCARENGVLNCHSISNNVERWTQELKVDVRDLALGTSYIFLLGKDYNIHILNITDGKLLKTLTQEQLGALVGSYDCLPTRITTIPDTNQLVIATFTDDYSENTYILDVMAGKILDKLKSEGYLTKMHISSNGGDVVTITSSNIRIWNLSKHRESFHLGDHKSIGIDAPFISNAMFDGESILIYSIDNGWFTGTIQVFDIVQKKEVGKFGSHNSHVVMDVDWKRKRIALTGNSRDLYVVDFAGNILREIYNVSDQRIMTIKFSPDGSRIALGGVDNKVRIFSLKETSEDLDKAKRLLAEPTEEFVKAQAKAAAANEFATAHEEWAKAVAGADEEILGRHAQSEWNAAKKKADGAESKAKDGDFVAATDEMKAATDELKSACGKALMAENTVKVPSMIARLEDAIKKKDMFASEDILAELEKMIPQDERMAGLRNQVAVMAGPKKNLAVDLGGGVKLEFVLIRPGTFMMGDEDNKPIHKVTLTKPFYIGKYEVTQEQWQAVAGDNPSHFKEGEDAGKRPVENVSWEDINSKFLPKLAERMPKGLMARLPTEAEWEYACRAGTTGDYAGEFDAMAWNDHNSENTTHPVGQKKANAWGLYDMYGNVWEWCADWYGDYSSEAVTDPMGSSSDSDRALRGGCWFVLAEKNCRSTLRYNCARANRGSSVGFRLVLPAGEGVQAIQQPEK